MHYLGIDISKKSFIVSILDHVVPFYFITHNQKKGILQSDVIQNKNVLLKLIFDKERYKKLLEI